jgi:GMP synthase (glutamine-hydrolysing)
VSRRIHVLQHDPLVPPGRLAASLPEDAVIVRLDQGEGLPEVAACAGIVSLGGTMGTYDEADHPFLAAEKRFLAEAHAAGIPILGICLGCQLLAEALGGDAYRAPSLEARYDGCSLTAAGAADPVARHLEGPVLTLHEDTWDPPPGAELLATTGAYPQAFRLGASIGIQPHPEATPAMAADWIRSLGPERVAAAGAEPKELLTRIEDQAAVGAAIAAEMFGAWLAAAG